MRTPERTRKGSPPIGDPQPQTPFRAKIGTARVDIEYSRLNVIDSNVGPSQCGISTMCIPESSLKILNIEDATE